MDHTYSFLDTDTGENIIVQDMVSIILDSDADSEWKPADSDIGSIPVDGEFSVQDMPVITLVPPESHSAGMKRKRKKRNAEFWKSNVRKMKWRNGEEHQNSSGKTRPARRVQVEGICTVICAYRCTHNFSEEERENIHKNFWALSEEQKLSYYSMYTERITKQRCRTDKQRESRRKFTFKYYLPISDEKIQVCKKFFLSILDISERRISYYHSHLRQADSRVHREKLSGKSKNKRTLILKKEKICDHTNSFPHICPGEEHQNSSEKTRPSRRVKVEGICTVSCAYRCIQNFSEEERENVHRNFWSLSEEEKLSYYSVYTERITKQRCRTDKQRESRRKFTFKYYLPISDEKIQVCKRFFLSILDISEKRISYYHSHLCQSGGGVHREKLSGKSKNKRTLIIKKQEICDHTNSFPHVCSHYCPSDTSREYLEQKLSFPMKYELC